MSQAVEIVLQLYRALSMDEKAKTISQIMSEIGGVTMELAERPAHMPPTGLASVAVGPASVSEKLVEARFAAFSPISWCRKVETFNPLEKGAYAIEGPWVKPKDMLHEGDLVFFGFKKPHVGYGLLSVEDGEQTQLTAFNTGASVMLQNVVVLRYAETVAEVSEKLKEFYL